MQLLILFFAILLLIVLIVKKLNPMLALLLVSVLAGLAFGMPVPKVISSVSNGIGSTLGSTVMVLALGAMIGKLAEESGAAQKLVFVLTGWFGLRHIQWAILFTGLLAGIPLFYNAGFVVLIPLVFALAKTTKLPLLYVGLPMIAPLSVTHGFLPPHPGPVALAGIFHANIGVLLLYGLLLSIPIAIIAGIVYPRLVVKKEQRPATDVVVTVSEEQKPHPGAVKSFLIVLSPVLLIACGTLGVAYTTGWPNPLFQLLAEPAIALLISLVLTISLLQLSVLESFVIMVSPIFLIIIGRAGAAIITEGLLHSFFLLLAAPAFVLTISLVRTILLLQRSLEKAMLQCVEGVKSIAIIFLIIGAGGAFKQILVDSNVGEAIKGVTTAWHLSPLVLGWLIAALFRVALGSATVAALTASGLVLPLVAPGVSPEMMVLSVGAGSLFCSHVNDTGFWMFKEYFGLTIRQTFGTWTVMESLISVLGLLGVLLLNILF